MAKVEIPDELHEQLEERAKLRHLSVPDVIAQSLASGDFPKRPLDEILDEILSLSPIHLGTSSADIIRELRGPLPDSDDSDR